MGRHEDARTATGGESPDTPARTSRAWAWLGFGVVIGFGLGFLFLGPSPAEDTPVSPAELSSPVDRETTGPPSETDTDATLPRVLGVDVTEDGEVRQFTGPLDGPFSEQDLQISEDSDVAIDASGTWLAVGETSGEERLLMMGRAPRLTPQSTRAVSFAWHDSRPGLLSFIEEDDGGERTLNVVRPGENARVIVRSDVLLEGEIAAWGDWGWAIQGPDEVITVLSDDGDLIDTVPGLALDSHGASWLVIINHIGLNVVIPGGGVVVLEIDYESIGGVGAASVSPDRKKIALVGPRGVKVTPINQEGPALVVPLGSVPTAFSWSQDSRFVILGQPGRSMVLDTAESGPTQISYALQGRSAIALATVAHQSSETG